MRKKDLLHMCVQNLLRRKSRTLLTVLGVLIGCCAIVIMMSLGYGMRESQANMLAQMGDLRVITVYPNYGDSKDKKKLDEDMVKMAQSIEGVSSVIAKYQFPLGVRKVTTGAANRYQTSWLSLFAVDFDQLDSIGYELKSGQLPKKKGEVLVGEYFAYNFQDTLRPNGSNQIYYWEGGMDENGNWIDLPDPFFDPLKSQVSLELGYGDNAKTTYKISPTGVMKEDYSIGWETSEGAIMDIEEMKELMEKVQKDSTKDLEYDEVRVKVKDISLVEEVENKLKSLGYNTSSMEGIRKPMEEEARQKQLMLSGLGAVSLFVAALGITNTMIMSISERTREIGVMKSLGCFVTDIRVMFLMEAGIIGLIGGLIGSVISFFISVGINLVSLGAFQGGSVNWMLLLPAIVGGEGISRVSVIPLWLYPFAILFSIFIGLGSGYYPANKAVKISALEAIKNE